MKSLISTTVTPPTDIELIDRSLGGQREAYGLIVERYQNLVCSMAYSACGNLARSEDLAQEIFLTAWKQLATLNDRAKFKSWLCGIARNLINNSVRRGTRDAVHLAGPLEDVSPPPADVTPTPADHAITREEESLVWNALAQVPETYREPLVLFYREGQSVQKVAAAMDLSEDAVKQRLARGRQMLKDQVAALVEGTLGASTPKKAFALAVVAALPAFAPSAAAATLATSAKGTAAVQSTALLTWLAAFLGPVIGLLGGYMGMRMSIENTKSPRERQFMKRTSFWIFALVIGYSAILWLLAWGGRSLARSHPVAFAVSVGGLTVGYALAIIFISLWVNRRQQRIQIEDGTHWTLQGNAPTATGYEYRSKAELLGIPLVHICSRSSRAHPGCMPRATGWIAIGGLARGILVGIGGMACGLVAIGGAAVGVFAFSGFAIGVLAIGGLAVGMWSIGGFAAGWLAVGGMALGWEAAYGGFACAHNLAAGGIAIGAHANDPLARDFAAHSGFVQMALMTGQQSQWLVVFAVLPVVLLWKKFHQRRHAKQP